MWRTKSGQMGENKTTLCDVWGPRPDSHLTGMDNLSLSCPGSQSRMWVTRMPGLALKEGPQVLQVPLIRTMSRCTWQLYFFLPLSSCLEGKGNVPQDPAGRPGLGVQLRRGEGRQKGHLLQNYCQMNCINGMQFQCCAMSVYIRIACFHSGGFPDFLLPLAPNLSNDIWIRP